ncbi:unnamed protein product [Thlaspi arvense]|uniref:Peptidase C1A papain C-terminal domain-containing protein n=1 Tax=Thlaspi arvense TaxID=13288 RepID=A0AAU9S5S3_THLAR|nr:unnamed protein product [Thlaspi arvense]
MVGEEKNPKSQPAKPAKVLIDIPNEHLNALNEIIKLVDPEIQPLVADVLHMVPKEILIAMINSQPDSKIRITECINATGGTTRCVRYASWTKRKLIPDFLKGVKWQACMGQLRDQEAHDVCWAIVVSELVRALRQIEGLDTDSNIEYSPQDLIDFVDIEKRRVENKKGHYCYTSNLTKGFEYVKRKGILREEDRPFTGCSQDVPPARTASSQLGYIKDYVRLKTIDEALLHLKKHPIGAAMPIFLPEYKEIGDNGELIYRGPVSQNSKFHSMHAVSLMEVGEENGESYVLARTSHGKNFGDGGYIKISLDVVFVYIPTPGEIVNSDAMKYFSKPGSLLSRFSYPLLLTKDEELQKKIDQDKEASCDRMDQDKQFHATEWSFEWSFEDWFDG